MHPLPPHLLIPNWPAPRWVRAGSTSRIGGLSSGVFASLNLGDHVGDDPALVAGNRSRLQAMTQMPAAPAWLQQVHGVEVLDLANWQGQVVKADASVTSNPNQVCIVMTADCLPVLFCCTQTRQVAAAHAGWRGLCDGVLEQTLAHFPDANSVMAWLGPCIGPTAFEVGDEVRAQFMQHDPATSVAFQPTSSPGKWLADLTLLAKHRLSQAGVHAVYSAERCTYRDTEHFFSYRREGQTGRMATYIWIES